MSAGIHDLMTGGTQRRINAAEIAFLVRHGETFEQACRAVGIEPTTYLNTVQKQGSRG